VKNAIYTNNEKEEETLIPVVEIKVEISVT